MIIWNLMDDPGSMEDAINTSWQTALTAGFKLSFVNTIPPTAATPNQIRTLLFYEK